LQKTSSGHRRAHRTAWKEEKKTISTDIRDVYADQGQRPSTVQGAAHDRSLTQAGRQRAREQETILDTYMQALGML